MIGVGFQAGRISTLRGVSSLFGETDPIETFRSPRALVAFADLDLVVSESGEYQAPRRRINQRGSLVLRHTLWSIGGRRLP